MKVLRRAAAANPAILLHVMSHIATLQRRSPRSLFITAFALSVSAFDELPASMQHTALDPPQSAPANDPLRLSLAIAFQLKGAKRRALPLDRGGDPKLSHDEAGGTARFRDDAAAYALRCSYALSLLCGLHTEISSVRAYIASSGNAFALSPLLNWVFAAEASLATDSQKRISLTQLEAIVRATLDCHNASRTATYSLLEAIVIVAASGVFGRDRERSVGAQPREAQAIVLNLSFVIPIFRNSQS
jgi:hypothetical protein